MLPSAFSRALTSSATKVRGRSIVSVTASSFSLGIAGCCIVKRGSLDHSLCLASGSSFWTSKFQELSSSRFLQSVRDVNSMRGRDSKSLGRDIEDTCPLFSGQPLSQSDGKAGGRPPLPITCIFRILLKKESCPWNQSRKIMGKG